MLNTIFADITKENKEATQKGLNALDFYQGHYNYSTRRPTYYIAGVSALAEHNIGCGMLSTLTLARELSQAMTTDLKGFLSVSQNILPYNFFLRAVPYAESSFKYIDVKVVSKEDLLLSLSTLTTKIPEILQAPMYELANSCSLRNVEDIWRCEYNATIKIQTSPVLVNQYLEVVKCASLQSKR